MNLTELQLRKIAVASRFKDTLIVHKNEKYRFNAVNYFLVEEALLQVFSAIAYELSEEMRISVEKAEQWLLCVNLHSEALQNAVASLVEVTCEDFD